MSEEKKVLTPEEVEERVSKLWDSWLSDDIEPEDAKKMAVELIREYGEQQREEGYSKGYDARAEEDYWE